MKTVVEFRYTRMTRQAADIKAALEQLPPEGGHISVDVFDAAGEVGHICAFMGEDGYLYARKHTPDPRNLYARLARRLRLRKIVLCSCG